MDFWIAFIVGFATHYLIEFAFRKGVAFYKQQKQQETKDPKNVADKVDNTNVAFHRRIDRTNITGFNEKATSICSSLVYPSQPLISGWVYYDKGQYLEADWHESFAIIYDNLIVFGSFKNKDNCDLKYISILERKDNGQWEGQISNNSRMKTALMKKLWLDFEKTEKSPILLRNTVCMNDEIVVGNTPIVWAGEGSNPHWMKLAIKKEDTTVKIIEVTKKWTGFTPVEIAAIKQKEREQDNEDQND